MDSHNLRISVVDTGVGIEESQISTIFEAFNKVMYKREMNQNGCGLGLTIVKNLVHALGG